MTADEIRDEARGAVHQFNRSGISHDALLLLLYGMAAEIAAQVAELNHKLGSPVEIFGSVITTRPGSL